jgi:hypothetical protein
MWDRLHMMTGVERSRRYEFPPLFLVPVLLIAAIIGVVLSLLWFGVLGIPLAGFAVYWLQKRADTYVRARESSY